MKLQKQYNVQTSQRLRIFLFSVTLLQVKEIRAGSFLCCLPFPVIPFNTVQQLIKNKRQRKYERAVCRRNKELTKCN